MQAVIASPQFTVSGALKSHIVACLQGFELRYGNYIQTVKVRLFDVNGPKGGIDKVCRFCAQIDNHPSINTEGRHTDLYMAIKMAARRMEHSFASILDEKRTRNPNSRRGQGVVEPSTQGETALQPKELQDELPSL